MNRPASAEPFAFWDEYFRTHEADSADLLANVVVLRKEKRFLDIQAAIRAFLKYRAKNPDPVLYEMLALAIERNGGRAEDVRTALGFAADLAKKNRNPVDLTRIADMMFLHKMDDRAGDLLELAMELAPGDARPLVMAINLAKRKKDPKLMGDAVAGILSFGWPGRDEAWRIEVRKLVDDLASSLRQDGRGSEAEAMLKRVAEAEPRDLFVRLTWTGDAGLDLAVEEPLGATATVLNPRTVFGGAVVKSGRGKHPESVYVCPRGFDGDYKIRVEVLYNDQKNPARDVTLEIITHEGAPQENKETRTLTLDAPKPVVVHLTGGRRKEVLPFQAGPDPAATRAKSAQAATKPSPRTGR